MITALWIYSFFLLLLGIIPAGRAVTSPREGREALSDCFAGFAGFLSVMLFLFRDSSSGIALLLGPLLLYVFVRDILAIRAELQSLRQVANEDRQPAPYGSTLIALLGSYAIYYPAYFLGLVAVLGG